MMTELSDSSARRDDGAVVGNTKGERRLGRTVVRAARVPVRVRRSTVPVTRCGLRWAMTLG